MKYPPACVVVFIMIPEVMNMNIILYMYLVVVRDSCIQLHSVQCTCTCSYCCFSSVNTLLSCSRCVSHGWYTSVQLVFFTDKVFECNFVL